MTNYERTANWLAACGKAPSPASMSLQLGCHFEEVAELLDVVTIESPTGLTSAALQEVSAVLKAIGINLKLGHARAIIYDREAALDALCDAEVTGNGVAYLGGFDKPGADAAVLDSNDDKLNPDGTPVIKPGGKIGKREGWAPPDLTPFVGELPA